MTIAEDVKPHIVDFDHHGERFRDENKAVVADLHQTGCPVGFSQSHNGYWVVYGYDAVYDAVQNAELFSSEHRPPDVMKGVPPTAAPLPFCPIDFDGPLVQDFRRVVLAKFSPTGAKADTKRIAEIVNELIDKFIESGSADLSRDLLTPMPAILVLEQLGWHDAEYQQLVDWVHTMIHDRAEDPEAAGAAGDAVTQAILQEIEMRGTSDFGDDLLGDILRAAHDTGVLDMPQAIGYVILLIVAGMDTTAGLTGNVVAEIARDDDLRAKLIADPSLLDGTATEEFLRHSSPSYGLYRTVTKDVEFHGQNLKKGDSAMLLFPAAGLDPSVFDDPDVIDFNRTGNRHMAFGLGAHRCLGSHHARVMFKTMIQELLRRMPDFKVDGGITRFEDAGDVYAIRYLPVTFTPGPRETS